MLITLLRHCKPLRSSLTCVPFTSWARRSSASAPTTAATLPRWAGASPASPSSSSSPPAPTCSSLIRSASLKVTRCIMNVGLCRIPGAGLLTLGPASVELGVVIRRGGANIPMEVAESHVAGYCLALDMTARDLQVPVRLRLPFSPHPPFFLFPPRSKQRPRDSPGP